MAQDSIIGTLRVDFSFSGLLRADEAVPEAERLVDTAVVPVLEKVAHAYPLTEIRLDSLEIDLGRVTEDELPFALERALRDELDRRAGPGFLPFLMDDPDITVEVDPAVLPTFGDTPASPEEQLFAFLTRMEVPWEDDVQAFSPVDLYDQVVSSLLDPEKEGGLASVWAFASRLEPLPYLRFVELALQSERFPEMVGQLEALPAEAGALLPEGTATTETLSSDNLSQETLSPESPISEVRSRPASAEEPRMVLLRRMAGRRDSWAAYRRRWMDLLSRTGRLPAQAVPEQGSDAAASPEATPALSSETMPERVPRVSQAFVPEIAPEEMPAFLQELQERSPLPATPEESQVSSSLPESIPSAEYPSAVPPEGDAAVLPEENPMAEKPSTAPARVETAGRLKPDADRPTVQVPFPEAPSGAGDVLWEVGEEEAEEVSEALKISDAGLILAHPFIRRLFQNLELVDEKGRFVSGLARVHAVHLLRHVTGFKDEHLGHRLLLEKALCGLPLSYSIPEEWEATPREKEETEGMLSALLSYWPTLRKSSIDALQRGFIQRAGTIGIEEGGFVVHVEGSAMDILLEELPWEISFILLPWLDKPILVEWQH